MENIKYKEIKMDNYCVEKLKCRCNNCDNIFNEYDAANYELVCFEDRDGNKYFLPSYGKYGYIDLLEKLVEEWDYSKENTKSVTEKFERKLKEITPYDVVLFERVRCPKCKTTDVFICERTTLLNHPIKWMKIDINKC